MRISAEQRLFIKRDDRVATKKLKTNPNDWFNKTEEGDAKRKDNYEKKKEFEIPI